MGPELSLGEHLTLLHWALILLHLQVQSVSCNFLKNRQFQVRLGATLSAVHELEMGVPQGSILSVTLFVLKINKLAEIIDKDILRSLFVDDFKICFKSTTNRIVTLTVDSKDVISDKK